VTASFTPTDEQRGLIELVDGCHLVQAPPGTGKTQVLTERIIRLLQGDREATFRILALTFTTKAAENLRRRVEASVGPEGRRVNAQTFHAFCLDVLQNYGEFVGFAGDTTVFDSQDDRLDVLAKAVESEGLVVSDRPSLLRLLERIATLKRALTPPGAVKDADLATAYAAYNRLLQHYHGCDFDDLLWLCWRLFTEAPRVARHYRRLYRFIMLDEAQDTSRAQYEILKAICGDEHRRVMLVADSDQFIYRFAGASDRWLKAFTDDFGAEVHHLTANFRCGSTIVECANRLIQSHPGRVPRERMVPANTAPGRVEAASFPDEAGEAAGVVSRVLDLLHSGLDPSWVHVGESTTLMPEDICILGRNRYSLDHVRATLEARGVPHLFNAGQRGLVETARARLVCQTLRILHNPSDRVTRENVLAEWSDALLDEGVADVPVPEFFARLSAVSGADHIAGLAAEHGPTTELNRLMAGLLGTLKPAPSTGDPADELLAADVRTLTERWDAYRGRTTPDQRSIGGLLGELALAGRSVVDGPGVRVLTVHAAKGLEFKVVVLVGMNEGTIPDYRSLGSGAEVGEEVRITYVAVTRASRLLVLTRPRSRRMPWGADKAQTESRFVKSMGAEMKRQP
jgi:DNA helicase-2/ATP-dependent DNA helicase PcrA